ncbi:MAG: transposase, partial [Theionarchaea archaeon]|nr:transposase [Theionarchaea archaeon]
VMSQINYHSSVDGLVEWYNTSRPHMSLGMTTPEEAFWHKLSLERTLGTASPLLYQTH